MADRLELEEVVSIGRSKTARARPEREMIILFMANSLRTISGPAWVGGRSY